MTEHVNGAGDVLASRYVNARRTYSAALADQLRFAGPADLEDQFNAAGEKVEAAFQTLLQTPASSPSEVADKLELTLKEYDGSVIPQEPLRLVLANLRALCSDNRVVTVAPCPVEPLAREAIILMRGIERLRNAHEGYQPEGTEYSASFTLKTLLQRLDALERTATHLAAKSAIGVVFQLCVAREHASITNDIAGGPGRLGPLESQIRDHEEAAWRLLSSAFEFFAPALGDDASLVRGFYMLDGVPFMRAAYALAEAA